MSSVRDVTSQLDLRRRNDRRRRWNQRAIAIGVGLAVLAAVYLVAFSSVLAVDTVSVSGAKVLDKQEVLTAAGIGLGTPLVRLDLGGVADRVAGLPAVAQVSVTREWPDAVRIKVDERKPRLAIPAGGGYLLADASGVVFQAVESLPSGLVVVAADPSQAQVLVDVGTVFSALTPATAAKVSRMEATSTDGIALRLKDGSRVIWGSVEESALKSEVLEALLPLGGTVFNVSAPAFPTRR